MTSCGEMPSEAKPDATCVGVGVVVRPPDGWSPAFELRVNREVDLQAVKCGEARHGPHRENLNYRIYNTA
jgi:hypothetical protein